MLVKKYKAETVSVQNPFAGVYTLEFSSEKRFKFAPGEFLHLALDEYDPSGAWPESRCFSIQTAPEEENIKITYAVKGRFTQRMEQELSVGKQVWLKLPFGDLFTQEHSRENVVFIAGGTGITPFLSLFTDKSFAEYLNPALYLGFRNRDLHFYHNETERAQCLNSGLKITVFYQDTDGVIDIEQIHASNPDAGAFFISGPPVMIKNFKQYLLTKGVNENRIKTDDWE
ncbi:MAG: FAD-dependent oxidoreductase [Prevotellaceae bacterium]|jgi:ferredoxin-NADP reductase|nr:FAD-dependent oxidoreductase [Prevotellaceae bacterium]